MFELSSLPKDEFVSAYSKLEVEDGTADADRNGLRLGRWSVGFFSCFRDCIPNGFMAFICPGVSVAQITARLGLMRYKLVLQVYVALYLLVLLAVVADSAIVNFLCFVAAVAVAFAVSRLRSKMRVLFDIPGNVVLDVGSSFVCTPCAIAQMASHAEAYQSGTCSFRARSTLEGYNGHFDAVKALLGHGACIKEPPEGAFAVFSDENLEVARLLLENGFDVNSVRGDGTTLLGMAALYGHCRIAQLLCEKGADLENCGENGSTPLIYAARNGHEEVVNVLLENGAVVNTVNRRGFSALTSAAGRGHMSAARILVEHGAEINSPNEESTALCSASLNGHLDVVRFLLECGAAVDLATQKGSTALTSAALENHADVVGLLLESGAQSQIPDHKGFTALLCAAQNGHVDSMEVLLEHGAAINAKAKDGSTALLIASLFGQVEAVMVLLARGAGIDVSDSAGKTPLMVASENKHSDVMKLLLDAGADVAARSENLRTPLLLAASGGDASCVELLLDNGADVNETDKSMRSCLHVAAVGGHLDVVMLLLSKGADINFQDKIGDTPLHGAVLQGHSNGVSLLLECKADVNMKNAIGWTPLMSASQLGNVEIAAILAGKGAEVDATTHDSRTALHLAAEEGHEEVVRMLLKRGAEVNGSDFENWTPLMRAAYRGHEQICRLLLDNQGDVSVACKLGRTALDIAYLNHRYGVVELLKEFTTEHEISPIFSTASRDAESKPPEWFIPSREVRRDQHFFSWGSFGKVYRGWWLSTRVVVKTVTVATEKESRTFHREARIWQKARHPNVVPFFGACNEESQYFFVCEEAKNGKLLDYLAQERKEGRSVLWSKLLDAALGLHFLHERHIVHSDLKCNQILVSKDGVAMLTDFGLSFLTTEQTGDEETVGGIRWKAPEVIRKENPVTPNAQSDVYSFGMCVVEAVTCNMPWGQQMPDSVVKYHVTRGKFLQRPRAFTDDAQWELVQGLCAFDPSKRTKLPDAIEKLRAFAAAEKPQGKRQACSAFARFP